MQLVIWSIQLVIYLYLVPVLCVGAAGHLVDPTGHLLVSCSSSLRGCCWSSGQSNWSSTCILLQFSAWVLLVIWSIQLVIYLYLVLVLCVGAAGHLVDPTGHQLVSCSSSLRGCCWSSGRSNWSSTCILF